MAKTGLSISKKLLSIGGICFLVTLAVVAITWGSTLATQSRVSTYAQTSTVSRDFFRHGSTVPGSQTIRLQRCPWCY